jgi:hypothetical protein
VFVAGSPVFVAGSPVFVAGSPVFAARRSDPQADRQCRPEGKLRLSGLA